MFERLVLELSDSESYLDVFLLSGFFTILSILLVQHLVVFRLDVIDLGGLVAVLLTSLAVSYPFVRYLIEEEQAELAQRWSEKKLLHRHAEQIELYMVFFLAVTLAFAVATFLVPESFFQVQFSVLESIRGPTGGATLQGAFMGIVTNNLWVFLITFVLTFFLSSGILFILVWNASVLGVLIGALANTALHIPYITLFYVPHGVLEIGAYVIAGIAGALLSYRVEADLYDDVDPGPKRAVTTDALLLIGIGIVLIVVAGGVEVI